MTYECTRCRGWKVIDHPTTPNEVGVFAQYVITCPRCNGTGIYVSRIRAGLSAPPRHGEFYQYASSQRITMTARSDKVAEATGIPARNYGDLTAIKTVKGKSPPKWVVLAVDESWLPGASSETLNRVLAVSHMVPIDRKTAPTRAYRDIDSPCDCFVCAEIARNGIKTQPYNGPSDMKLTDTRTGKTMYASQSLKAKIEKIAENAKKGKP